MKREQAIIAILALFIGGYLVGRMTAPSAGSAVPATASAPAEVGTAPGAAAAEPANSGSNSGSSAPAAPLAPPPAPVAAAGGSGGSAAAAPSAPADPNQIWRVPIFADDAKKGPDSAKVKVVVFAGFGNQESSDFAPVVEQVAQAYGDKIQIHFKQKAVPLHHPDAIVAAEASLAANAQGKFWPFFDKAMKTQATGRASLESLAQEIGCDMAKFKKDLDAEKYRGQVLRDSLLASEVAAHSYPNILVNGVRLSPPKTLDHLKELIDQQIAKNPGNYDDIVKNGKFFEQTGGPAVKINTDGDAILGSKTGKIEVEVFEDFQCPFCSKLAPSIHDFAKKFPNDVRIVYKQMPLDIHDHAQIAAEASMAALAQGKFWEYHDVLFANQSALDRPDLEKYAQQVGLDMARFKKDLDSGAGKQLISRDKQEGANLGVTGTPSVFINGLRYQGPRGYPPEGLEAVARVYLGLGK